MAIVPECESVFAVIEIRPPPAPAIPEYEFAFPPVAEIVPAPEIVELAVKLILPPAPPPP